MAAVVVVVRRSWRRSLSCCSRDCLGEKRFAKAREYFTASLNMRRKLLKGGVCRVCFCAFGWLHGSVAEVVVGDVLCLDWVGACLVLVVYQGEVGPWSRTCQRLPPPPLPLMELLLVLPPLLHTAQNPTRKSRCS